MTAGAELLIRTADAVTYNAVTRHGHRMVDWLTLRTNLQADPHRIIQDWLEFYKPTDGDLTMPAHGLVAPFQSADFSLEKAADDMLSAVHRQAKKTLGPKEYDTVLRGGEYLVLIQGKQVAIRHGGRWQTLDELLLQSKGKVKPPEPADGRTLYFSDRGLQLAGQAGATPVLTVELTDKWHDLYVIQTDGKVIKFLADAKFDAAFQDLAEDFPDIVEGKGTWNPHFLWQLANKLGIAISGLAFDLLVGRWTRERDSFYD